MPCSPKASPALERMIYAIDHVQLAIPVGAEDAARRFYVDLLGFAEVAKPGAAALRGGAWFVQGHVNLHLGVEADFRPARKAHPALLVENLEALLRRLEGGGVKTAPGEPMTGYRRAFVSDPFGNRIELMQKVAA